MNSTILVIGATGNVGKELVKVLTSHDHTIRATVRPTTRTDELKSLGVSMVEASINDTASLKVAMNGVETCFS